MENELRRVEIYSFITLLLKIGMKEKTNNGWANESTNLNEQTLY